MNGAHVHDPQHRHGRRVHSHPHRGPHRHLTALKLSEPARTPAQPHTDHDQSHRNTHGHGDGHEHTHGLVDDSIKRSQDGIRAVLRSLAVLALAGVAQTIVFVASGSIALLADLIHNFGDALTAVPLGIAFALRSALAEQRASSARASPASRPCRGSSTRAHQRTCRRSHSPARSAMAATSSQPGFARALVGAWTALR